MMRYFKCPKPLKWAAAMNVNDGCLFFLVQIKKLIREKVKQAKIEMGLINKSTTNHIEYGLGKNTLILKLQRSTVARWRNQK